jgi:hypothetical protein
LSAVDDIGGNLKNILMKSNSKLTEKLSEAKALYAEILESEQSMLGVRDEMLARAWKLGRILTGLKEEIGHGKWLFWLGGTWPDLGERNAQRCIGFFKSNENWKAIGNRAGMSAAALKFEEFNGFEIDSVRKFMWNYIPEKDRLELDGDQAITPGAHHLTFVNQFSKYDRQLRNGNVEDFSIETFKREIEPMLRRLAELCGRDWISSVLG